MRAAPLPEGDRVHALAHMGAGFADPVHGAQQAFRALLTAMSLPGRLHALPEAAVAGLAPAPADLAPPLGAGLAATLLTLLDADAPVLLAGGLADAAVTAWIRFHTGARAVAADEAPALVVATAADVVPALWERLDLGSDESPQDGATLVVEVDGLSDDEGHAVGDTARGIALALRGPGIASTRTLRVAGLSDAFWQWRAALSVALPRGVDLLLLHGTTLAALPRSSRLTREA